MDCLLAGRNGSKYKAKAKEYLLHKVRINGHIYEVERMRCNFGQVRKLGRFLEFSGFKIAVEFWQDFKGITKYGTYVFERLSCFLINCCFVFKSILPLMTIRHAKKCFSILKYKKLAVNCFKMPRNVTVSREAKRSQTFVKEEDIKDVVHGWDR